MIEFRPIEPAVLTDEEAATYLRLPSVEALNRLVDGKRTLHAVMYGKRRLYRRAELDRFLSDLQSDGT